MTELTSVFDCRDIPTTLRESSGLLMHRSGGRLEFYLLDIGHGMLPIENIRQKYCVNTLCVSEMHRRIAMRCLPLVFAVWLILLSSPTLASSSGLMKKSPTVAHCLNRVQALLFSPHTLQCLLHPWSLLIRCIWSGLTNTTRIPRPVQTSRSILSALDPDCVTASKEPSGRAATRSELNGPLFSSSPTRCVSASRNVYQAAGL